MAKYKFQRTIKPGMGFEIGVDHVEKPISSLGIELPETIDAQMARIHKKVRNPNYPKLYDDAILKYVNDAKVGRFGVVTLAHVAEKLAPLNVCEVFFNDKKVVVEDWQSIITEVLSWAIDERFDVIEYLDAGRQLGWLKTPDKANRLEALRNKTCEANFSSYIDLCIRLQWIFLASGISLNKVAIKYQICTENEWKSRLAKQEAEQRAKIAKAFKAKKDASVSKSKGKHALKKAKKTTSSNLSTYIVVDGVVVPMSNGGVQTDTIVRSSSDYEDVWKGVGYIARDNGKYGSISGEDYAD